MKGLALGVAGLLLVYVFLELAVLLLYKPEVPPVTAVAPDTTAAPDMRPGRERAGLGFRDPSMTIHPYLGYVFLPNEERDTPGPAAIAISEDGFLDARPAVRTRAPGRVIVGVTGGSVSGQLGTWHTDLLREALSEVEAYRDATFDFVWLGMPGYHQPQQVIQLSYILTQGGEFDVLINLDGFNEVAVPAVLNAPQGAHPLFPMNWSMVALDVPDARVRKAMGAVAYLKEERAAKLERFHASFWSYSPIAKLVWRAEDRKLDARLSHYAWQLTERSGEDIPWFVRGPGRMNLEEAPLVSECVAVWERCSRQLEALCDANGIRYVHVLQPNQYDPGSKPLSGSEKDAAFDPESPYKPAIERGYPLLREAGERLRADGITFIDLSRVFEDAKETLYVDNCCHFNKAGNRILVDAIVGALAKEIARSDS